jgi:molybdopterin converting factor small subunit
MSRVTIRYWAAAKAAAGTGSEEYDVGTLAELVRAAKDRHGDSLGRVLSICSFLVDDVRRGVSDPQARLPEGACVEALPPFAGG